MLSNVQDLLYLHISRKGGLLPIWLISVFKIKNSNSFPPQKLWVVWKYEYHWPWGEGHDGHLSKYWRSGRWHPLEGCSIWHAPHCTRFPTLRRTGNIYYCFKGFRSHWYSKIVLKEPCCWMKPGSTACGLWETLYSTWPFSPCAGLFLHTMGDASDMSCLK